MLVTHTDCQLKFDNSCGLIFPASIRPICGTVNIDFSKNKFNYFEIVIISDKNSNEVARIPLLHRPDKSGSDNYRRLQISFIWNLRGSKSNHYVESGCYTVSLIGKLDEAAEVNLDSIECKVVDMADIPSIIRYLKHSHLPALDVSAQRLLSYYLDIIEDIEYNILERLRENQFEDPYFIACTTLYFIQEIVSEIANRPESRFLFLIKKFASNKSRYAQQQKRSPRFNLWPLFDFLVNYMANLEDQVRARAMAKCGQSNFTESDKAQIISSMVSALYPYCKTMNFAKNVIGRAGEKIFEELLKFGIKYECTKHLNRSVAIC
jgi:hypothetical protein